MWRIDTGTACGGRLESDNPGLWTHDKAGVGMETILSTQLSTLPPSYQLEFKEFIEVANL